VGRTAARATGAHAQADSNLDLKEGIFQEENRSERKKTQQTQRFALRRRAKKATSMWKWDNGGLQSWGIRHQSKGVGVLKGAAREEPKPRGCGQRGLDVSAARDTAPHMYASDETLD
jgi:hypothetical protein